MSTTDHDGAGWARGSTDGKAAVEPLYQRPVPERPWLKIALAVIVLVAALTAGWEVYWRGRGFETGDYKDSKALWAKQRRLATGDAAVLVGSSRILFDSNLDAWEKITGERPIQLGLIGTSPRIVLADLAADNNFHGLAVVDVMAPLFFGQVGGYSEKAVPYAHKQTLSERWDHELSAPLEESFAFIDDVTRPKQLIFDARWIPARAGQPSRRVGSPGTELEFAL